MYHAIISLMVILGTGYYFMVKLPHILLVFLSIFMGTVGAAMFKPVASAIVTNNQPTNETLLLVLVCFI